MRRHIFWRLYIGGLLLIIAGTLALTACGGGSSNAVEHASDPLAATVQTCAPGDTGTPPDCQAPPATTTTPPPTTTPTTPNCAAGQVINACVCQNPYQNIGGVCALPPVTVSPACPVGYTPLQNNPCTCSAADLDVTNNQCVVPNPACPGYVTTTCPVVPPVTPTPPTQPTPPVSPPPTTPTPPSTTYTLSIAFSPASLTLPDDQGVTSACSPTDCASANWQVTSAGENPANIFCTDNNDQLQGASGTYSAGPYPPTSDGVTFAAYSLSCTDINNTTAATASLYVTVVAPAPLPVDTLSCSVGTDSSGNPDSTCVYTSYVQGDACYVWDMSATSGAYALTGGGQGNASGTVQGPAVLQPVTFSLQCTLTSGPQVTVQP